MPEVAVNADDELWMGHLDRSPRDDPHLGHLSGRETDTQHAAAGRSRRPEDQHNHQQTVPLGEKSLSVPGSAVLGAGFLVP